MKAGSLPHRDQANGPLSAPHDNSCLTMDTVPVTHGKSQHCRSPLHHMDPVKNTSCIQTSFVQHRLLPKAHRFSPEHISTPHSKPFPTAQRPMCAPPTELLAGEVHGKQTSLISH